MITSSVSRLGGGLFTSVRRLGQSLESSNPDVSVHVLSTIDPFVNEDVGAWYPLKVKIHAAVGPWSFRYSPGIGSDLRSLDLDIVHVHHLWMYPSVATLRWHGRTRRPYIVTASGMIDRWAVNQARFKKWFAWHAFEKQHLSNASCIHALGESEIDGIRRRGIQTPICVIPNGIDIPPADRELPSPPKSANRLQLLFLGRLHPKKGVSELLAAWRKWQKEDAHFAGDWKLLLAGWGETGDIAKFKREVHEFGIDQTVKFVGPVFDQDKADLLKAATAFILPSFSEGLPIAVLEAWAYGLPALITPQCNLRKGIVEGAAISINPSADSIREGLAAMARLSDTERRAMGLNGYRLVMSSYSWPIVAAQMKEVYDWSIGGGQAPASVVTD